MVTFTITSLITIFIAIYYQAGQQEHKLPWPAVQSIQPPVKVYFY